MLRFLKGFFGKPKHPDMTPAPEPIAPYKVEAPTITALGEAPATVVVVEPAKCGCGRSSTGFCVGLHKLSPAEWAAHPDNPTPPVAEQKPVAKKAPVKKKPAATKAPAKSRAPAKPKATK